MTVTDVQEANLTWSRDQYSGQVSVTAEHIATTDDQLDGPETVAAHPGVPQKGSDYQYANEVNADLVYISQSIQKLRTGALLAWRVTTTWQIPDSENNDPDPDTWDDKITMSNRLVATQWHNCRNIEDHTIIVPPGNGAPIVQRPADTRGPATNSAGARFEQQPAADESIWVLTIERIYTYFEYGFWSVFDNRVNSDEVKIDRVGFVAEFEPTQMRCASIRSQRFRADTKLRWRVNFEFWIRELTGSWINGWRFAPWDVGREFAAVPGGPDGSGNSLPSDPSGYTRARPVPAPDLISIIDESTGIAIPGVVDLDGHGFPLRKISDTEPGVPVQLIYTIYDEVPFAPMLLWDP